MKKILFLQSFSLVLASILCRILPSQNSIKTDQTTNRLHPTSFQAANISKSEVLFQTYSSVGSGLIFPQDSDVNVSMTVIGKFRISGHLSHNLEVETYSAATKTGPWMSSFYLYDKTELQNYAKSKSVENVYFTFFQAAANFGYNNTSRNNRIMKSNKYNEFSQYFSSILEETPENTYTLSYNTTIQGNSKGSGQLFIRVLCAKLTLKSGKNVTVLHKKPTAAVTFQDGTVFGYIRDDIALN